METCDDCGKQYRGPAYYTFDDCWEGGGTHLDCTNNTCPACTGPFLDPDNPNDPRRPPVDYYDENLHEWLEKGGV